MSERGEERKEGKCRKFSLVCSFNPEDAGNPHLLLSGVFGERKEERTRMK